MRRRSIASEIKARKLRFYTIKPDDVGRPIGLPAEGFGNVLAVDIRKRVFSMPYGTAMENDSQRDTRLLAMREPRAAGHYVYLNGTSIPVSGKRQRARVREIMRGLNVQTVRVCRWDGAAWHDSGRVLCLFDAQEHSKEGPCFGD